MQTVHAKVHLMFTKSSNAPLPSCGPGSPDHTTYSACGKFAETSMLLDSGAAHHITPDPSVLFDKKSCHKTFNTSNGPVTCTLKVTFLDT
jgi:hypothetical protein